MVAVVTRLGIDPCAPPPPLPHARRLRRLRAHSTASPCGGMRAAWDIASQRLIGAVEQCACARLERLNSSRTRSVRTAREGGEHPSEWSFFSVLRPPRAPPAGAAARRRCARWAARGRRCSEPLAEGRTRALKRLVVSRNGALQGKCARLPHERRRARARAPRPACATAARAAWPSGWRRAAAVPTPRRAIPRRGGARTGTLHLRRPARHALCTGGVGPPARRGAAAHAAHGVHCR